MTHELLDLPPEILQVIVENYVEDVQPCLKLISAGANPYIILETVYQRRNGDTLALTQLDTSDCWFNRDRPSKDDSLLSKFSIAEYVEGHEPINGHHSGLLHTCTYIRALLLQATANKTDLYVYQESGKRRFIEIQEQHHRHSAQDTSRKSVVPGDFARQVQHITLSRYASNATWHPSPAFFSSFPKLRKVTADHRQTSMTRVSPRMLTYTGSNWRENRSSIRWDWDHAREIAVHDFQAFCGSNQKSRTGFGLRHTRPYVLEVIRGCLPDPRIVRERQVGYVGIVTVTETEDGLVSRFEETSTTFKDFRARLPPGVALTSRTRWRRGGITHDEDLDV